MLLGETRAELMGRLIFSDLVVRAFAYSARTGRSESLSLVEEVRKILSAVDLMIAEDGELPHLLACRKEGQNFLEILGQSPDG